MAEFSNYIRKHILIVTITSACMMNGCVTKKYTPTSLDLPDTYRTDSTPAQLSDSGIASLNYHQFFSDPSLLQLIDSGIAHNYTLQIAIGNIQSAEAAFRQTKWNNIPTVSLAAAQVSINRPSDNSLNGLTAGQFLGVSHIEDYMSAFNISWEADIWGKIKNRKSAALAAYLQSQEAARGVQTKLVSDIAQGYYNLLMLDDQLEITKHNISVFDSSITATNVLREAGNVTVLAVQQLEATREQAVAIIPQLQQQRIAQENALSVLTGRNPGNVHRNSSLSNISLHDSLPVALPVQMVSMRPDIRQAEYTVMQAHAQMNIAKTSMYPVLSITAQGGLDALKASQWFNVPGSLFGMATGSLVEPLVQNRRLKTQYEQSKIARQQSEWQFKQTVLMAVSEMSNVLVELEKVKERINHTSRQVSILESAVKNSRLLYENGDASYLDVLTAQSNKLQADLALISLQRERLNAEVALYEALGGGYK